MKLLIHASFFLALGCGGGRLYELAERNAGAPRSWDCFCSTTDESEICAVRRCSERYVLWQRSAGSDAGVAVVCFPLADAGVCDARMRVLR